MTTHFTLLCSIALLATAACSKDGAVDSSVDSGADSSVDAGSLTHCEVYCTATLLTCTGDNAQYSDLDDCLRYCSFWNEGTDGETSGNSLACRASHIALADADPATHCVHAGPTGGSVCGTLCENYCRLAMSICTDANSLYATSSACTEACGSFASTGHVGDTNGNTFQCRIYHLGLAAVDSDSAAMHCPHASMEGGGVCAGIAGGG